MLEVVATTPSRPFGACATDMLDMAAAQTFLNVRFVVVRGKNPPQLTFIRQNWRSFQPCRRSMVLAQTPDSLHFGHAPARIIYRQESGPWDVPKSYRRYTSLPGMAASPPFPVTIGECACVGRFLLRCCCVDWPWPTTHPRPWSPGLAHPPRQPATPPSPIASMPTLPFHGR